MKASATDTTIALIAACVLAGALSLQCGPTSPITAEPQANGGNRAGGATGTSPTAGGGGVNGSGGTKYVLTAPPPAGGSTEVIKVDAAIGSAEINCGVQTQNPAPQPVDLLLVLDRSGSMANDMATDSACPGAGGRRDAGPCSPKWPAMTASLNQVLASSPAGVQWGLKFFTSPRGSSCTVNAGADVAVGPNTATQIQAAIAGTSPADNTPTKLAINAAVAYFKTVNDGLAHYNLLATDGQPNCESGSGTTSDAVAVTNTVAAIQASFDAGIKTYVIGIGPSTGNLDNFAQAGGTGTYFPATSPDALTAALTSIVKDVASCVFTMAAVPPDPTNLGVYLDKTTKVPLDPSDGYSLSADSLTVTLNGSYCAGLKDGTYQVVQVYFGCPGEPPPPIIP
jgi:hypothetical protein